MYVASRPLPSLHKDHCRCLHCYSPAIGDFTFETQEEFDGYFDALMEAIAAGGVEVLDLHNHDDGVAHEASRYAM